MAPNREIQRLGQIALDVVWETKLYATIRKQGQEAKDLRHANNRILGYALMAAVESVGGRILPAKTAAVNKRALTDKRAAYNPWNVALYDAACDDPYRWSVGARSHLEAMEMADAWVTGRWDGAYWEQPLSAEDVEAVVSDEAPEHHLETLFQSETELPEQIHSEKCAAVLAKCAEMIAAEDEAT